MFFTTKIRILLFIIGSSCIGRDHFPGLFENCFLHGLNTLFIQFYTLPNEIRQ